jgi:hypothetical protein
VCQDAAIKNAQIMIAKIPEDELRLRIWMNLAQLKIDVRSNEEG